MSELDEKHIVITRAQHQAQELAENIEAEGGIAVYYPCIALSQSNNSEYLDSALENLTKYDWLLLTSCNTAQVIAERLNALALQIDWSQIKIAVVGKKTQEAVQNLLSTNIDFIPEDYTAYDLAQTLPLSGGEKVLLPQSALAKDDIQDILIVRRADVTLIEAYSMTIAQGGDDVPDLLMQNQIDAITFTSGSTVRNFIQRIEPLRAFDIPAICIGSSTYDVAIDAGFERSFYPENHTLPDMIDLLIRFFDEVKHGNI